ncbi:TonB-dependent receptor [Paremcibacter congregatus]|uniref:TonB-dependent receptor n=1 Tax=Paremcibacter congregatus TaxID=2043170 RepID=A0A2G4YUQ2_9PROT|nr:TonB-dependent receptor [Paremcibacter congregatus]PHZ85186.1 TonB-dependent receptor [Paremcibacter congregatus]QDE27878.1 TonB-dependent receptor [Paremcibacter congregatus]
MTHNLKKVLLLATSISSYALINTPAYTFAADENDAAPSDTFEEVVVTGSRIKRKDLTSVGPVSVVTQQMIRNTGITSMETLLQRLPSSAGFGGNQTAAYWVSNGWGTPQVNLRGLGVNRTLVLLNGRRLVNGGTGANSSVDLSMIPMAIVKQVEVLKDGASAIYGADAVAGVVNIITDTDFNGLEASAKFGMTGKGDGEEYLMDLTWGTSSDQGSLVASLSYQDNKPSPLADRVPCPLASDSETQCNGSSSTAGGRAVYIDGVGDLVRINFNNEPGGKSWAPYDRSIHGYNYNVNFNAVNPIKRLSFSSFGHYNLTDDVRLFGEMMYTNRRSTQPASPNAVTQFTLAADHPTNPTGEDLLVESRRLVELGERVFLQEVNTFRIVAGVEGSLSDSWSWDVALNWGRNTGMDTITNVVNLERFNETIDPNVCGTNGIPCGDYLGVGNVSQAVLDYLPFDMTDTGGNEQLSLTANISGDVFELPAGKVGFAAGVEYREDKGWRQPDSLKVLGIANSNAEDPISGKTKAKEAYAELSIPVLAEVAFAKNLDLNLALRFSDYDTFSSDTNYKIGVNWQVVEGFKLRGTYSTAFRVPNVPELFGGVSEGNLTTTDPCSGWSSLDAGSNIYKNCQAAGVPVGYTQLGNTILTDRGGNPNLEPEDARSLTFGAVWQPGFAEGLSVTVDYFDVKITDAITEPSGSVKLAQCYESDNLTHDFCTPVHHTRNAVTGEVNYLSAQKTNAGSERLKGIDVGVVYNFNAMELNHTLDFQVSYLDTFERTAFEGDVPMVLNGFIGAGFGGYPKWRANTSFNTSAENWSATYSVQYIGAGDDFFATDGIGSHMGAVMYHNVQGTYNIMENLVLSAGIDNLWDKKAPRVASWTDGNTDTMTYDLAGRRGYIRLTYRMQ